MHSSVESNNFNSRFEEHFIIRKFDAFRIMCVCVLRLNIPFLPFFLFFLLRVRIIWHYYYEFVRENVCVTWVNVLNNKSK